MHTRPVTRVAEGGSGVEQAHTPISVSGEAMKCEFREIEIDDDSYTISCGGASIDVEPKVFEVLIHLIRHRDRMVTKLELLQQVWRGCSVSDSAVARCVCLARRVVGEAAAIRTVHGRGYQWVAPLTFSSSRDARSRLSANEKITFA
jgi:DNA-binding winged helix-turn-helix (wHTH) protein